MSDLVTNAQNSSTLEEQFADLPFLKVIAPLLGPISCQKLTTSPFNFLTHYVLSEEIRDIITKSWNASRNEHKIQVALRVIQTNPDENIKQMPYNLKVIVNDVDCKLPELSIPNIIIGEQWRYSLPINITQESKLTDSSLNELKINWDSTFIHFQIILSVIEKLYPEDLVTKLKEKPLYKFEYTKNMILKSKKIDNEISVDSFSTTLMDPLTQMRMKLPARGVNCIHIQCFDGINFLQMNEQRRIWICPLCTNILFFKDIKVDEFFLNIIQSKNLSKDCETVILYTDGSWSENNKQYLCKSKQQCSSNIKVVTLSDTDFDNEVVYPTKSKKRQSEYLGKCKQNHLKKTQSDISDINIITLSDTDDEDVYQYSEKCIMLIPAETEKQTSSQLNNTSSSRNYGSIEDSPVASTSAENPPNKDYDDLSTSREPVSTICLYKKNNGQKVKKRSVTCITLD